MKRYLVLPAIAALALGVGSSCSQKPASAAAGPGAMPAVQVVAVAAKRQPVTESLSLVGTITANEMVEIKAEIDGNVAEIGFEEGARVKKGDLLVRLDETKLKASAAEAEANFKLSQSTYERAKQLHQDKLISQQEFDQSASAFQATQASYELKREQLRDARILAPFAGIVGARNISPGQVINKSTTLTWLVDFDPVKVEVNIPERFVSQLKLKQTIEIAVATYPDKKFKGEVYFIAPQIDPTTRTALIKARLANPDLELKPGMFANLDLALKIRENAILIPETAINQLVEGDRASVFVIGTNSTAQLKIVHLGVRLPGQLEVLEGLAEGDNVIIEGLQKIGPGAKVATSR